jgi:PAS domain S-box-containing protein
VLARYGLAFVTTSAALALRLSLESIVGPHLVFALFLTAAVFVGWSTGLWPALFSIVLGIGAVAFFLFEPIGSFRIDDQYQVNAMLVYFVAGVICAVLSDSVHRARSAYRYAVHQRDQTLQTAAIGLARYSRDMRYITCNEAYALLASRPAADLIGRTLPDVWGVPAFEVVRPYIDRVLRGERVEFEVEVPLPQGLRWINSKFAPWREPSGEITGWVASLDTTTLHETERALRESEARYRALIELSPQFVWMSDLQGRITYANQYAVEWTGKTQEQLLGDGWADCIHPDHRERVFKKWKSATADLATYDLDIPFRHHDGTYRMIYARAQPVRDGQGNVAYWIGTAMDVDDRRRAEDQLRAKDEEARRRLLEIETVYSAAPAGLVMLDLDMRYVRINHALAAMNGIPAEAHLGRRVDEVLPEFSQMVEGLFREVMSARKPIRIELAGSTPANPGAVWDEQWYPLLDADGELLGVGAVVIDITERKRAEQALQEANRRKDEFLATLAHELRNPLAPIRNSLYILRKAAGLDLDTQVMVVDMMERQVNHMIRLVDDLLEVSRITRGKIELRRELIDVADVVRNALETAGPVIEAARHHLALDLPAEPVFVEGDPVRLAQVVGNLLNNAAKYTSENGRISLRVWREDPKVYVSVRDNGSGIPAEMLPRVFDLFAQVDRTLGRAQGGLGIGLALVKQLVEMHGGAVKAWSDGPGKGSEFIIELPIVTTHLTNHEVHNDSDRALHTLSGRVLVVDDNRDAADSLAILLKSFGLDAGTAYDGLSALEAVRVTRPAVVFLDLGMPGMDGYAVASEIRAQPHYQGVVLVALTGWGQEHDRRRTKDAGFAYHVVKPADIHTVRALLDEIATRSEVVAHKG